MGPKTILGAEKKFWGRKKKFRGGRKSFWAAEYHKKTVSYEEIFPGNFGVGGIKNFLGEKKRFLRGNFPAKFPRPEFPQEILARILLAEEILEPKVSWRHEEILRGNSGITS